VIEDQITTLRPYNARYTGDPRSIFRKRYMEMITRVSLDLCGVAAVAATGRVGALSSTSFARPDQKDRLFQELRQADAEPPGRKEGIGVLVVPEAGKVEHWREDPP
jgi:hypothetical protein